MLEGLKMNELRNLAKVFAFGTLPRKKDEAIETIEIELNSYAVIEGLTSKDVIQLIDFTLQGALTSFEELDEKKRELNTLKLEAKGSNKPTGNDKKLVNIINNTDASNELCITSDDFTTNAEQKDTRNVSKQVNEEDTLELFKMESEATGVMFNLIKEINKENVANKNYDVEPFAVLEEALKTVEMCYPSENALNKKYFLALRNAINIQLTEYDHTPADVLLVEVLEDGEYRVFVNGKCYTQQQIIKVYNDEQNAQKQIFINNAMMNKPATPKQLSILTNSIRKVSPELQKEIQEVFKSEFKSMLVVKLLIDKIFSNAEPTENQIKFAKKLKQLGFKTFNAMKTSKDYKEYIDQYANQFAYKNLKTSLSNFCGLNIDDTSFIGMSEERIKELSYKVNKVGGVLGLVYKFTNDNVFNLIDKISSMSAIEQLNLQQACLTKDMTHAKTILKFDSEN